MITYEVAEYKEGDTTVEMTFTDDDDFVYKRSVNIPYNDDGTIDEDYLQEIFEGQLRGVENKLKIGVITFTMPEEELEELSEELEDTTDPSTLTE